MKNPFFAASYESGVELMAAGCPLDYPDALPRQSFRAEQLPGYADSRIYELGPCDAGWVISLRFRTDRPGGTIITSWSFEQQLQNHDIVWGELPEVIIPKYHQDVYKSLVSSRLMKVLNEGHLIRRGHPVEGVLCGHSAEPIGESSSGAISGKLIFTTDRGNTVPLCITLNVYRLRRSSAIGEAVPHRLFRHVDPEGRLDPSAIPTGPGSESGSQRGEAATCSARPSLSQ
jgi:hypothetical protein